MAVRTGLAGVIMMALAASALPAAAQPAPAAVVAPETVRASEAFIKDLSDRAFAVLRDRSLKPDAREQRFRTLLRQGFALDIIGDAVLGRSKRVATPDQLKAFNEAFPDFVIRIYATRLTDFSDTSLRVLGSTPVGSRGDLSIRTQVVGKNLAQPVRADWRVRQVPGQGPRIIDLSIEGISMVATQRDEFDAKVQRNGFAGLVRDVQSGVSSVAVTPPAPARAKP
jgi:phospholipid transport system substrate-binding protein